MKYVYLIDKYDPTDHSGEQHFMEAWSTEEFANMRCEQLKLKDSYYDYYVHKLPLDITEDAALELLYGN